jgi:uncharacterized protein
LVENEMTYDSYVLKNIKDMHFEVCNVCDLSCIYCSAFHPTPGKNPFMPLEIAQRYIELVFRRTCAPDIGLMFYGGEALLQKVTWFRNVIEYANYQATKYNKKLHFYMQSCATVLDSERLDLIGKYNIVIGTSLDGPPEINEKSRGKTKVVMDSISKLKEIGCFGGVICTANEYNYDGIHDVLQFFEEQEIFWVAVNIVYSIGRGQDLNPLSTERVFSVYNGIYNYFEQTRGKKVVEANMAARLDKYVYPPSSTDFREKLSCNHPICGGGITLVLCDSNGDLYPCGCANMTTQFRLGNVNLLNDDCFMDQIYEFHTKSRKHDEKCHSCHAAQICNFGCAGFRAIDKVTDASECNATKMLHSFLAKRDPEVIQEVVHNLRTGKQEHDWRSKHPEA